MKFIKYTFILALIACVFYVAGQYASEPYIKLRGETMGTYYNIKILTSKDKTIIDQAIKKELAAINSQMSVFEDDSEISRLNQAKAGEWITLSPELSYVLKSADKVYKRSQGHFDPSVGPLVDLWGFGVNKVRQKPDDKLIAETLKTTGFDKLEFSQDYLKVKKLNDTVYINLSAIAKGYGVDRISEWLLQKGLTDFVVEIGGEVRAHGRRSADANGWFIGMVEPVGDNQDMQKAAYIITLQDSSVATSGDYRNYFYIDNQRYSHTISPKTGRPVTNNIGSVTVFAKKCMNADAYATAIMSLGEDEGLKFAKQYNLPIIMFVRTDDGGLKTIITPEAEPYLEKISQ